MIPEFSRLVDTRHFDGKPHTVAADPNERALLAGRFGIVAVDRLEAEVRFARDGATVVASGRLRARIVQNCAVSGEPVRVTIDEPLALRFVHGAGTSAGEAEIELAPSECDEIEYAGHSFDLGEAVAQSLALAIDPYVEGPQADAVRKQAGLLDEAAAGPFAALAALKK